MVQMWLLWLPKNPKAAAASRSSGGGSVPRNEASSACFSCKRFSKLLMRKLKKRGVPSRQSSLQCRYDPMSYSLNFDTSGCGSTVDDHEDYYYKFYAFSSRFVAANPTTTSSSPSRLVATASHQI
ncbi:hypothetical protein AB3S75_008797 [Citrus x aurantiifolia]